MENNEIIIYRGRGKKVTYSNINSISVIGNKIILDEKSVLKITKISKKRLNIKINGTIKNSSIPLDSPNDLSVKRVIGRTGVFDIEINGNISKLVVESNNINIGISSENLIELNNKSSNIRGCDEDLFVQSIIKATNTYETFCSYITKDNGFTDICSKLNDTLHYLSKANSTFTACSFAPYLNSIISNIKSMLDKYKSTSSNKSIWVNNLITKYYISKIYNSSHFRNIMGTIVVG